MKKLTFLVSTFGSRIQSVPMLLLPEVPLVDYLIVAQSVSMESRIQFDKSVENRSDVRCVYMEGKGLTRSRNVALDNIPEHADIVYFLDDDVVLEKDSYEKIARAFRKTDYGVITFPVSDLDGSTMLKNYRTERFRHNKFSIMKVGSIEIGAIADVFRKHRQVEFPEYMGVGARFPQCEEPVFINRLMEVGISIGYVPTVIVRHPIESTGKVIGDSCVMMARGVAFREIFGVLCVPLSFAFFCKSFKKIKYRKLSAFFDLYKGTLISRPQQ